MLEDLIVAAFNDAAAKVTAHTETEMQKLTGGLQLPRRHEIAVLIAPVSPGVAGGWRQRAEIIGFAARPGTYEGG